MLHPSLWMKKDQIRQISCCCFLNSNNQFSVTDIIKSLELLTTNLLRMEDEFFKRQSADITNGLIRSCYLCIRLGLWWLTSLSWFFTHIYNNLVQWTMWCLSVTSVGLSIFLVHTHSIFRQCNIQCSCIIAPILYRQYMIISCCFLSCWMWQHFLDKYTSCNSM